MCACRCGIRVYTKDGAVRYIEGNPKHPKNRGVLCAKGSAGIMQHLSPARLQKPLLRVGERGSGEFREIEWDEALALACRWLGEVRRKDPKKLAFFTGRDQSQSLTGWWAQQFGTPNYAAHGGFCSVNMAAAGFYSVGGSFWEFGEPDWHNTRYLLLFGVAEDHDSNPIKIGLGKLKNRGGKCLSVNPVRTGYSAIADEWLAVRPGGDGAFVASLIHLLLKAEKLDFHYLGYYTNASHLIIDEPGSSQHGLFLRDSKGEAYIYDSAAGRARRLSALSALSQDGDVIPALTGRFEVLGRQTRTAFDAIAERFLSDEYSAENTVHTSGIAAADTHRIAAEIAHVFDNPIRLRQSWTDAYGRKHESISGAAIAVHAMRGIAAHSNGFDTCRLIHLLQILLGTIDRPGGFLYKPPYPKAMPPLPKPHGVGSRANTALDGAILGYPQSPQDLLIEADGSYARIDKGFSWDYPLSAHGLLHMLIHNAARCDPYSIDVLFLYMTNMAWNSAMNPQATMCDLTAKDSSGEYRIKHIIYADAYDSEMVGYADLVLPDTTYLERWDCISLLDRPISSAEAVADAIRRPVVSANRDVRPFQDVLIELGGRLGLSGFVDSDGKPEYKDYPDYIVRHQRSAGIGPLAGWRGEMGDQHGVGAVNPRQLQAYIDNDCFYQKILPSHMRYYRHVNRDYLEYAHSMGWVEDSQALVLTPYSEPLQKFRLAAQGHGDVQPPSHLRQRIGDYFDPIAKFYVPFESPENSDNALSYPLYAVTQRPMFHYHSWGAQNAWLRQIANKNCLYLHVDLAAELGIDDGDWIWVESRVGRIRAQAKGMLGCEKNTVWTWNAMGKRRGKWGLDADAEESNIGFLLNHLIPETDQDGVFANADPLTGQAAWYDLRVRIYKCESATDDKCSPRFEACVPLGMGPPVEDYCPHSRKNRWGKNFKSTAFIAEQEGSMEVCENVGFGCARRDSDVPEFEDLA